MNFLDATLAFMEDAADIVLKAPECDDDGIGRYATPVPSRTREPRMSKASRVQQVPGHTDFLAL
jgi:hypothetical protein